MSVGCITSNMTDNSQAMCLRHDTRNMNWQIHSRFHLRVFHLYFIRKIFIIILILHLVDLSWDIQKEHKTGTLSKTKGFFRMAAPETHLVSGIKW